MQRYSSSRADQLDSSSRAFTQQLCMRAAVHAGTWAVLCGTLQPAGEPVHGVSYLRSLLLCRLQGYYRRGDANFMLGKFKEALKDLKTVRTQP
jgi:hypothetical protein